MSQYDEPLRGRLRQLGHCLRTERLAAGLSQEELADRSHMHRTYVGSVERGERNISVGSAYALADALGVTVVKLFGSDQDERG